MKMIKITLQNKMENEYLANNMVIYIEKEISKIFNSNLIIDELKNLKNGMIILYICVISFIVIVILNYVFIFIVLVTIIKYIHFECIILAFPKILIKITQ